MIAQKGRKNREGVLQDLALVFDPIKNAPQGYRKTSSRLVRGGLGVNLLLEPIFY